VGVADFVMPLIRRWRMILLIVGIAAMGSVVAALVWPQAWRASVTLLPPDRRMDNPVFLPGGLDQIGPALRGITLRQVATPTDIFVAILESRTVAVPIVERFGLQEEYGVKNVNKAVAQFAEDRSVSVTREGLIQVTAVSSSAERAADIANALVEELDRVNQELAGREATSVREFVERELNGARDRLAGAEDALRAFQESHGAIEVTEQARAVIAAAAQVRADILATEVELGVLRRTRDASHPDVRRAEDYLVELRRQQKDIEGRDLVAPVGEVDSGSDADHATATDVAPSRDPFPPLSQVPSLGLRFGRLFREVKTEETVVGLLTEQYHRARIEERRALPTVRVLDPAVPPERRFRPRRTIMVILITGAAAVFAAALAYGLEVVDRIRNDPARFAGIHAIARDLRKGVRS
ncbi:MAG TPA: hypothetical protein VKU85_10500, partial [bacterium]|nr:hypothetical protein [bacterium]